MVELKKTGDLKETRKKSEVFMSTISPSKDVIDVILIFISVLYC